MLDAYQVLEARVAGADAVLLIAECLEQDQMRQLHDQIRELGMAALVEFYEPQNLGPGSRYRGHARSASIIGTSAPLPPT